MVNKGSFSKVFLVCIIIFFAYKYFPIRQYKQVDPKQVDKCKEDLIPAYFKGEVLSINVSDNKSKLTRTIYLKILDSSCFFIPDSCEYLKFRKNILLLTADNLNISTGPEHQINEGDIITKFKDSDSISVCTKDDCCKFYFPLFDGLGTKDSIVMKIIATSPCP